MKTEVIRVDAQRPAETDIRRAADCLRRGGLVAFPTETVYGLGVHALDAAAVRRLFEAKARPANDPLIVHIGDIDQIETLVSRVPELGRTLAERFWPGPLTLVLRRHPRVPAEVTAGLDTVAVRVPAHPVARALLAAAAIPIAAPSANLFSRPSPTTAAHVLQDLDGRIDMVIDAGPTPLGVESTVLDLASDPPRVLRPGGVAIEALRALIPGLDVAASATPDGGGMPSPGLLPQHYAPRAPMTLYVGDVDAVRRAMLTRIHEAAAAGTTVGVLATREQAAALGRVPAVVVELGSDSDVDHVARRLYAALRELDALDVDVILAHDVSRREGLWRAIGDRLARAAVQSVTAS